MIKTAKISEDGKYRYQLSRIWNNVLPKALFIMLNPSTADHEKDDPTIRRCINFVKSWGGGGLYVGNLFAYRTSKPTILLQQANQKEDIVGILNDFNLRLMAHKCTRIVFAWGNNGSLYDRDKQIIKMFPDACCLDLSKNGHPKHPLYLKNNLRIIKFIQIHKF